MALKTGEIETTETAGLSETTVTIDAAGLTEASRSEDVREVKRPISTDDLTVETLIAMLDEADASIARGEGLSLEETRAEMERKYGICLRK